MSHRPTETKPKNAWICDSEKVIISSPVLNLIEQKCHSSETQKPFTFYVMRSKNWCNLIPITEDGKIVLVKQHRAGISNHTLEIPGGVVDHEYETHEKTALRELEEETGYTPLPNAQITPLGWSYPNPAILDNRCFSYIVGPVSRTGNQNLDPGEMIEVVEVPIENIPRMIQSSEINHALILNAFFYLLTRRPEFESQLTEALRRYTQP